jgi:hypothetical protein
MDRMLGLYFNQQFNWCCKKQLYSFHLAMLQWRALVKQMTKTISHFHCLLPQQATVQADLS